VIAARFRHAEHHVISAARIAIAPEAIATLPASASTRAIDAIDSSICMAL